MASSSIKPAVASGYVGPLEPWDLHSLRAAVMPSADTLQHASPLACPQLQHSNTRRTWRYSFCCWLLLLMVPRGWLEA